MTDEWTNYLYIALDKLFLKQNIYSFPHFPSQIFILDTQSSALQRKMHFIEYKTYIFIEILRKCLSRYPFLSRAV